MTAMCQRYGKNGTSNYVKATFRRVYGVGPGVDDRSLDSNEAIIHCLGVDEDPARAMSIAQSGIK
jgi:hypothetical protein